jgi:hypothetical protein
MLVEAFLLLLLDFLLSLEHFESRNFNILKIP